MAEYLSPGVYVEDLELEANPLQSMGIHAAGFVGLTECGPLEGQPQQVNSFAEYQATYGGYLGQEYGSDRFLPYAVEQFFANGGCRAYIVRVAPAGQEAAGPRSGGIAASVYLGQDHGPGRRTGLQAFLNCSEPLILVLPGVTSPEVQNGLLHFCESNPHFFAVLDLPLTCEIPQEVLEARGGFNSSYGAVYHPWLQRYDPIQKENRYFPPSGAVAGIYARTDLTRGVHKAPANEVVRGCTGLSYGYDAGEQGILNPNGVNLIRSIPGQGIRVWGARTLSADSTWKYVNIRRLFIFIEQSIYKNLEWATTEPNDPTLWNRVTDRAAAFLANCWRSGMLAGASPEEAFYVNCGPATMTQDDQLNGRLICEVGIACVRPAEFIVFRVSLQTMTL